MNTTTCQYLAAACLFACFAGGVDAMAGAKSARRQARGYGFIEYAAAAPVSRSRGIAATADKDGRPVILVWLSDHRACKSILVIDAITGRTKQYPTPKARRDSPFAVLLSSRNKFYSLLGYTFMEFDPAVMKFTFSGKATDRVAMSMTEDHNGIIWAANYPKSHVTSFDPKTKKLTNYGQLNKETWPQYPRAVAVDRSGWVYLGIGNVSSQIAALDPKTRKIVLMNKKEERRHGRGHVFVAKDGKVYGSPCTKGPKYEYFEGKTKPVDKWPAAAPIKASHQGAVFKDFPDGRKIKEINIPEKWVTIKQPKSGKVERLTFDYQSEGSHILSIILGPDGKIYGSTGHPLRIFCYDRVKDTFTNNGLLNYNGHWNALAVQRKHIFGGQYGGGILWEYDPAQPWADRAKTNTNPRRIFHSRPHINRPAELLAHPDGRHLILTGGPGYGLTGGGMHIHDLDTGKSKLLTHKELIPNQATMALEALPDGNLVGGTTISPGTGGKTLAKKAELYIMDFKARKIVWHAVILPGATTIRDLKVGPDGLVYGLATGPTFFVFDPEARKLVHKEKLAAYGNLAGGQAPRTLVLGPDKKIYALFSKAIVRIEPGTFKHTKLATPPVGVQVGIVLLEGRLYFTHGSRVWSYKVPGL